MYGECILPNWGCKGMADGAIASWLVLKNMLNRFWPPTSRGGVLRVTPCFPRVWVYVRRIRMTKSKERQTRDFAHADN